MSDEMALRVGTPPFRFIPKPDSRLADDLQLPFHGGNRFGILTEHLEIHATYVGRLCPRKWIPSVPRPLRNRIPTSLRSTYIKWNPVRAGFVVKPSNGRTPVRRISQAKAAKTCAEQALARNGG
jgi:hypothetical protein